MDSGTFLTDDHIEITWRSDGQPENPPLILANSLGTDMAMWDAQIEAWSKRYYVIRHDMRGHGASQVAAAGFGINRFARDVLGLLDHLEIVACDFVGLSLGGMVGQYLGIHAPERLGRLILANTSAYMGPPESWDTRISAVRDTGMAAIANAVVERWFTPEFRATSSAPARILTMLLATDPQGYAAACTAIRNMDQRGAVCEIGVPTLVIGGIKDPATPPEHAEFLASSISNATLKMLPAAHLSNIECPDQFGQLVLDFLGLTH